MTQASQRYLAATRRCGPARAGRDFRPPQEQLEISAFFQIGGRFLDERRRVGRGPWGCRRREAAGWTDEKRRVGDDEDRICVQRRAEAVAEERFNIVDAVEAGAECGEVYGPRILVGGDDMLAELRSKCLNGVSCTRSKRGGMGAPDVKRRKTAGGVGPEDEFGVVRVDFRVWSADYEKALDGRA